MRTNMPTLQPRMTIGNATKSLSKTRSEFVKLFEHGSLEVEYYQPKGTDKQIPHSRDELYVIASGTGMFVYGDSQEPFEAGEVLFVPAGVIHRFEDFSEDFATWVFFYGPEGGEANT